MKLKNIHLFLILLIVLILSHFGFVIREGAENAKEDQIYIDCEPEGKPRLEVPKPPPTLDNPVIQAVVAVGIAIIIGVIIRKLM